MEEERNVTIKVQRLLIPYCPTCGENALFRVEKITEIHRPTRRHPKKVTRTFYRCPRCREVAKEDEIIFLLRFPKLVAKLGWNKKSRARLRHFAYAPYLLEATEAGDVERLAQIFLEWLPPKSVQKALWILKRALSPEDYAKFLAEVLLEV